MNYSGYQAAHAQGQNAVENEFTTQEHRSNYRRPRGSNNNIAAGEFKNKLA